ncbi:ATP-binding protein [Streptomyces sp. XD-27]|uniref:ATP-binding protein n=1 Tax=Streptomyces sp. XD-27 TaxID=3062779 RepID=UPI0026F45D27|nr:ATP-binding protein [Streptomyces sp. XD-27]WKX68848.1 ATP-binding protein [Streptomyces sp. XD-27]
MAVALPQRSTTISLLPSGGVETGLCHERFQLPARGASVAAARRRVRGHLPAWGFGGDACDAVELVISELVTNALVHTASEQILCVLRADAEVLYVEVADQGGGPVGPSARQAGADDECGRGLMLVRALADAWGDRPVAGGGRAVWAQLRR